MAGVRAPDTPLATGAEFGENVASARFPGELPGGRGRALNALVENERVGERAELGSRLLHRDRAGRARLPCGNT